MGAYKSAKLTFRMITFRSGIRYAPPKREIRICEYMHEKEAIVLGRIYCEFRKGIFFDRKWFQRRREKSLN